MEQAGRGRGGQQERGVPAEARPAVTVLLEVRADHGLVDAHRLQARTAVESGLDLFEVVPALVGRRDLDQL